MAKKRSKPSALTTMGIYMRHLGKTVGADEDALSAAIDFMPPTGILLLRLEGLPSALQDPATWEAIDKAASSELGQPVVTTLADGVATVDQKQS